VHIIVFHYIFITEQNIDDYKKYLILYLKISKTPKYLGIIIWVLLTGAPGALVKHTIKGNYYHKKKLFLTLL